MKMFVNANDWATVGLIASEYFLVIFIQIGLAPTQLQLLDFCFNYYHYNNFDHVYYSEVHPLEC